MPKVAKKQQSSLDRILESKKFESLKDVVTGGENAVKYKDKIPTGSLILDIFLDGGFRCGMSRFIGEPEHGKTAQALTWAKYWQDTIENGFVLYINAEGRITEELLKRSGIDLSEDKFRIVNHNIYEDVADLINDVLVDNPEGTRYFIIIDSADALICQADVNKPFSEAATIAGGARMASAFNKRNSINIGSRGHHMMILSQTRANLAARAGPGSGGTTESGGKALGFYSSLTGKIDKLWTDLYIYPKNDKKQDPIGHYFSVKFAKTFNEKTNKRVKVPIKYGVGIWLEKEIMDLCLMYQLLTRSGAWYNFDDDFVKDIKEKGGLEFNPKHQGEHGVLSYLEQNKDLVKFLEKYLRETLVGHEVQVSESEQDLSEVSQSEEV